MILIIIKFWELLLRISQRIINTLRSYIKHLKECFLLFPDTSKLVKKRKGCASFFQPTSRLKIRGNTLPRVWYITSQQSSSTFILVELTSNGRCRFYRRTILLPAKNAFVCLLFTIRVSKTFLTSHSGWTLDSDHCENLPMFVCYSP